MVQSLFIVYVIILKVLVSYIIIFLCFFVPLFNNLMGFQCLFVVFSGYLIGYRFLLIFYFDRKLLLLLYGSFINLITNLFFLKVCHFWKILNGSLTFREFDFWIFLALTWRWCQTTRHLRTASWIWRFSFILLFFQFETLIL